MKKENSEKVVVAMSGGVDSSVAAALLKKAGFDVIGVFMKFWAPRSGATRIFADGNADLRGYENRCCSSESEKRARLVAKKLGIPFYVFNFEKEFKKKVVDYFLEEYKFSRTPNPCVVCNKEIKFGLLLKKALSLGADYVATGHYARLRWEILNPKSEIQTHKLLKGKDKNKDQSYFLWRLNQKQLKHILFPVGDYTKEEVRKLAKKFNLSVAEASESQEICFVREALSDFLREHIGQKPGKIVDIKGNIIAEHQGLWFYTIGQRKGIGLAGGPYWVLNKDIKKNLLIVTQNEKDLLKKELQLKNINWVSGKEPKMPLKIMAKIRYRHTVVPTTITKKQKSKIYNLKFNRPQRAITPGQSAVFYKGKEVFGGGTIDRN